MIYLVVTVLSCGRYGAPVSMSSILLLRATGWAAPPVIAFGVDPLTSLPNKEVVQMTINFGQVSCRVKTTSNSLIVDSFKSFLFRFSLHLPK